MAVITYLEAISQALRDEMRRDPDVILLGEDIGVFGGAFKITRGFIDEFGAERVIDTPIAESGFVGAACAAAIEGLRPVVEFQFADFIVCASIRSRTTRPRRTTAGERRFRSFFGGRPAAASAVVRTTRRIPKRSSRTFPD